MYKFAFILTFALLASCGKPLNVKQIPKNLMSKKVYVVLDYVEYRDDIGKLLNYDQHTNSKRLKSLQTQIENLLIEKGITNYQFIFFSSGIDFNPEANFQLVSNNEELDTLINPPFIFSTVFNNEALNKQFIDGFKIAQEAASFKKYKNVFDIKNFPVISNHKFDNSPKAEEFETNSIILYSRVMSPELSFGKKFITASVTGALTLAATGGSSMLITTPYGLAYSNMVLINNENGELLWRGRVGVNITHLNKKKLFQLFDAFPSNL